MNKTIVYDHTQIEGAWQQKWSQLKANSIDLANVKKPFYNLMMFPYPSAEGLHVGNMYAFTGSDIYGRFKRLQGYDVFEPIGLDGFGIHSENFALKIGRHPVDHAQITQKNYYAQLKNIGAMFDWERTVETYAPGYYKWTQWLFVQMFKHGLAYRDRASVNWCPKDKTVLADEQVIDKKCERCGNIVEKRLLEQWFFRITAYAEKLLVNLPSLDWSSKVKIAQTNWIGKSEGKIISFKTERGSVIEVFTTRPDTLSGVTFLATSKLYKEGSKEKIGEFSGEYAMSPLDGRKIPIWDTNYVAPDYGTGVVMGVPAHDQRDGEFAKKYGIEIIKKEPQNNAIGTKHVSYHLRDWLISRQRYWGPPIPMIRCKKCEDEKKGEREDMPGWYSVPEKDLPVLLPRIDDYTPGDDGIAPLAKHKEFYEVKCPGCGGDAVRETDVSDTFLDSSWYFLRYPSKNNTKEIFDKKITKKWLPVDMYTGGAEHSVLHLLYSRFVTMALKDWGHIDFEEPFKKFYAHGLVIKDGAKMSKSKGNVINPDEYIRLYGADALRLYLMFMGPFDQGGDFRDASMEGMSRWVGRVWRMATWHSQQSSAKVASALQNAIKRIGDDLEKRRYNTAIATMMEFTNLVADEEGALAIEDAKKFLVLLAPFAPHMTEELWQQLHGYKDFKIDQSIHTQTWPVADKTKMLQQGAMIAVQVNGKLRDTFSASSEVALIQNDIETEAKKRENVQKHLAGKEIKKVIFVPGKLINFVVS